MNHSAVAPELQTSTLEIAAEVTRQLGRRHEIQPVHVSDISAGDTIFHEGKVRTVSGRDVSYDSFMGHKVFGDSYMIGHKPVQRIIMGQSGSEQ